MSRAVAHETGASVTSVELSEGYVAVAERLTRLCQLDERVSFECGDATDLNYEDRLFDAAFLVHANMNVRKIETLFSEASRVLKPGAPLALWEFAAPRPMIWISSTLVIRWC